MEQVPGHAHSTLSVFLDELAGGLHEQLIDLLERLVLGLVHEEDLVEPAKDRNTAVETESQTSRGERLLHAGEVVCDDERGQEQPSGGGGHSVRAKVGGVDLRGDDPSEGRVGTEEEFVENEASEIHGQPAGNVAVTEVVRGTDKDKTDEETRQHSNGPEATTASLHEEDGGDGTDQKRATTNEGHVSGIVVVEANLGHENRHVIHNGVDPCSELAWDFGFSVGYAYR